MFTRKRQSSNEDLIQIIWVDISYCHGQHALIKACLGASRPIIMSLMHALSH